MSLKKKKGSVYIMTYECNKPGCDGQMIFTGGVWASVPVLFDHSCNKCNAHLHLDAKYPHTEAIADEEDTSEEVE